MIYFSRPSIRVALLRNITVSASADAIDVWLSFLIVFYVISLYHNSGHGWSMKGLGRIIYVWNVHREIVIDLGCLASAKDGL